jgi:hypothetical protein
LDTPRLILREMRSEDATELLRVFADPRVMASFGAPPFGEVRMDGSVGICPISECGAGDSRPRRRARSAISPSRTCSSNGSLAEQVERNGVADWLYAMDATRR